MDEKHQGFGIRVRELQNHHSPHRRHGEGVGGVEVQLEKVESFEEIARYGVLSTPGVVIDGQSVHVGGVPKREKIQGWQLVK